MINTILGPHTYVNFDYSSSHTDDDITYIRDCWIEGQSSTAIANFSKMPTSMVNSIISDEKL